MMKNNSFYPKSFAGWHCTVNQFQPSACVLVSCRKYPSDSGKCREDMNACDNKNMTYDPNGIGIVHVKEIKKNGRK